MCWCRPNVRTPFCGTWECALAMAQSREADLKAKLKDADIVEASYVRLVKTWRDNAELAEKVIAAERQAREKAEARIKELQADLDSERQISAGIVPVELALAAEKSARENAEDELVGECEQSSMYPAAIDRAREAEAALHSSQETEARLRGVLEAKLKRCRESDTELFDKEAQLRGALAKAIERLRTERDFTSHAIADECGRALSSPLSPHAEIYRAERRVLGAAEKYKQAIRDHAGDSCQCGEKCLGDCGPINAAVLLKALSDLTRARQR